MFPQLCFASSVNTKRLSKSRPFPFTVSDLFDNLPSMSSFFFNYIFHCHILSSVFEELVYIQMISEKNEKDRKENHKDFPSASIDVLISMLVFVAGPQLPSISHDQMKQQKQRRAHSDHLRTLESLLACVSAGG